MRWSIGVFRDREPAVHHCRIVQSRSCRGHFAGGLGENVCKKVLPLTIVSLECTIWLHEDITGWMMLSEYGRELNADASLLALPSFFLYYMTMKKTHHENHGIRWYYR